MPWPSAGAVCWHSMGVLPPAPRLASVAHPSVLHIFGSRAFCHFLCQQVSASEARKVTLGPAGLAQPLLLLLHMACPLQLPIFEGLMEAQESLAWGPGVTLGLEDPRTGWYQLLHVVVSGYGPGGRQQAETAPLWPSVVEPRAGGQAAQAAQGPLPTAG